MGSCVSACATMLTTVLAVAHMGGGTARAAPREARISSSALVGTTVPLVCTADTECTDDNPCTQDACVNEVCTNTLIPDCVPCDVAPGCPPVDVVFVMDTSGSMADEAAALCASMGQVVADLDGLAIAVTPHFLGITETQDGPFACLTDNVNDMLGGTVPQPPTTSCQFPDSPGAYESWGPATAIVAARFTELSLWTQGAMRVIVPISDEGPCDGSFPDGCNDPGDDRESIDNAIAIAVANNVIVSPITGTSSDDCVIALATALADGTGGVAFQSQDPGADLAAAIFEILLGICEPTACNDGNACTQNDLCVEGTCAGTAIPDCVPCSLDEECDDGDECTYDFCASGACDSRNISSVPCTSTDECFGGVCNSDTGLCECALVPTLCLEATPPSSGEGGAYQVGEEIVVDVVLGTTRRLVFGGQFLIGYDPSVLDFVSVVSGSVRDPTSPFSQEMDVRVDEAAGRIFYAVFTDFSPLPGSNGPAVMASLTFVAVGACQSTELCFFNENPQNTLLTGELDDSNSTNVEYVPCCTGSISVECTDTPRLCLKAAPGSGSTEGCYDVGEEIVVDVMLGASRRLVFGGQFLVGYDPSVLEFVSVVPGSARDPTSPFSQQMDVRVDEASGRIFYAVFTDFSLPPGTKGPAVMASLTFVAVGACLSTELCFLNEHPQNTLLTGELDDSGSTKVDYVPCCSGGISVGGAAPALTCPRGLSVNADPGQMSATVTWDPITAQGGCLGTADVKCTSSRTGGVSVDHLVSEGGQFPLGVSTFSCTATSGPCGGVSTCQWSVDVRPMNTVEIDLELSSTMAPGPLERCIEFMFFSDCVGAPQVYELPVTFGYPFDFPGRATGVALEIPIADYGCVTARDRRHTVLAVAETQAVGRRWVAVFDGDPSYGGNRLVGGNINGDYAIDILDLATVRSQFFNQPDPDTPCGYEGVHADINGDGIVDSLDEQFVLSNWLGMDGESCCSGGSTAAVASPITEITVKELRRMGLGHLGVADVNGDGIVNLDDFVGPDPPDAPITSSRKRVVSPGR